MHVKGRPVYAIIDLSAAVENVNAIRSIAKSKKIIAVVKDDAYGHGASHIVKAIDNFVDIYGVACVKEALQLKKFTKKPFIVFGSFFNDELEYFDKDIMPVIYDIDGIERISKKRKIFFIHLEFDTGMGRTGFMPEELDNIILKLKKAPHIKVNGVMTHLASAEKDENYTMLQIKSFKKILKKLNSSQIHFEHVHIANSAGMFYKVDGEINAVRPGIMIYGGYPSISYRKRINLKPVMTFLSQVIYLKKVKKGTSISYGCNFVTKRDSIIATLAVGYGDGYPRHLANKGKVYVVGKGVAPVVGNVCMDMIMIDVTDLNNVKKGDEVVLWGIGHDDVHPDKVAEVAGTISYELFCRLSKRVKKIYRKGHEKDFRMVR